MTDILDGFEERDARLQEERQQSLRAVQVTAGAIPPDRAARANALADKQAQPFGVVAANLDDFEQQERGDRLTAAAKASPITGDFLNDERRMALAGHEAEPLAAFANSFGKVGTTTAEEPGLLEQAWGAVRSGWLRGQAQATIPLGEATGMMSSERINEFASSAANLERQAQAVEAQGPAVRAGFENIQKANETENLLDAAGLLWNSKAAIGYTVLQSAGQAAPALAATLATGGAGRLVTALTAGGGSGITEYGASIADAMQTAGVDATDAYEVGRFLRDPAKMAVARDRAEKRGVAVGLFDALTAGLAGTFINNARRGIASVAPRVAAEAGLQIGGGAAGEAAAQVSVGDKLRLGDIAVEGLAELPTALPEVHANYETARRAGTVRWINERLSAITGAAESNDQLRAQTEMAAELQLGKLSPQDMAAFVQQAAGDSASVYLPAEQAQVLFQSEAELVNLVGSAEALAQQMAAGELVIPMSQWMTVVPHLPNRDEILQHARTSPDGLSPAELEAYDADALMAELGGDVEAAERARPGDTDARQQVIDDVTGQLLGTERYTPASAEAQGKVWGAFFGTLAQQLGQNPLELYQRYMGGVRSGRAGGADPRAQRPFMESGRTDALIDSIRVPGGVENRELYGPSLTSWLREQGGVTDSGGELRGMDAGKLRPGLVSMMGLELDRARELAAEAGYLPADSTPSDLLDLIDRDLRQGDVYSPQMGDAARQRFASDRAELLDAIQNTPALRDLPPEQFAAMTNQQIAEALSATTLDQAQAVQTFTATTPRGTFRLTDERAPAGADFSEFGEVRIIEAFDGDEKVGQLLYANDGTPPTVEVEPSHQRRGIATAMLKLAKQQGGVLGSADSGMRRDGGRPGYRTDAGQAFRTNADESSVTLSPADEPTRLFQADRADQTDTPAFKAWFGDSKVVDANGSPLVVYHGTAEQFEAFDPDLVGSEYGQDERGFFFTDNKRQADSYARNTSYGLPREGGRVVDAYLSMQNPLIERIDFDPINEWDDRHQELQAKAQAGGHDGVIIKADKGESLYVAFRPEQIKSATANRGTFDPSDPSILNQQGDTSPRGQIEIFPDRRMAISLFEKADRSTFLHESGHFFLEVLRDLSAQDGAPQRVTDDMAALVKWFGVDSPEQIGVDQHEQFARGFEHYLAEGKAPSPELQTVFAQFKAWLLGIYRSLRNLNVDMTDDVRGVFDRMLATDEEIEVAQARQGMKSLAATAADAATLGMDPQTWADYIAQQAAATEEAQAEVLSGLVKAQDRALRQWWKDERAATLAEVEAEFEAQSVYRAARALSGAETMPDGTPIPAELRVKLSKTDLVKTYGEAYLKRLRGLYSASGGVSAEDAAMMHGYASGDDLVKALANRGDLRARAEAEADSRMLARHGDPFIDGRVPEMAMDAVHNDRRMQVLEYEMRLLEALAAGPTQVLNVEAPERAQGAPAAARAPLSPEQLERIRAASQRRSAYTRKLQEAARQLIARKTSRQLRPNDFLAAERRAALEAQRLAMSDKPVQALAAKRRQAFNAAMFRETRAAQQEFDRATTYLRRMGENRARARLGKAGADYLDQVDALLEGLELRPVSGAEVQRRLRLADWVRQQEAAGNVINVPQKLLDDTELTNIRDMPIADLREVVDTVKQIDHLAKLKNKLLLGNEERDREAVDAEMAGSVLGAYEVQPQRTGDQTRAEKLANKVTELDIQRLLPTNIARELDGYVDGGPVWRHVMQPIREAMYGKVMPATTKMQEDVAAMMQRHYSAEEIAALEAPVWREAVADTWSRGRILSLAMNWGSAGNREAILDQAQHRLTPEQVGALLGTLDARDFAFAQEMVDLVNSYWPEIAATQKRRTGMVPEKVEAAPYPIITADGKQVTFAGGYYPLKYDAERSGYGATQQEMDAAYDDLRVGRTARASTRNGHTIERVGSGGKTVQLGLDIATGHMRSVIRDLHLGDAVNYAHQVLHGKQFMGAVTATGRREYLKALDLWLKDVATGEMGARNLFDSAAAFIRQNLTAAVLTYKPLTAMLQLTGLFQTGTVLGRRQTLKGVGRLLGKSWIGPESIWADLRRQSPYLNERFGNVPDSVQRVAAAKKGKLSNAHASMVRWGYTMMGRVQMIADAATWLAAQEKGLREFDGDIDRARAYADDIVVRLQAPDTFIEKMALSRGTLSENVRQSEMVKATTMLLTYMIAKGNVQREMFQKAGGNTGNFVRNARNIATSPRKAMVFGLGMMQLFLLETIAMDLARGGLPKDDDDDGWVLDDWMQYLAKEMALGQLSTLPVVSQLATAGRGYDAQGPLEKAWSGVAKSVDTLWENFSDDEDLGREDLKAITNLAGVATGVPSSQLNTTNEALWRVYDGEDVSPADFVRRPPKEK